MKRLIALINVLLIVALSLSLPACDPPGSEFTEAWENATVKTYRPSSVGVTMIKADEGYWHLGDTVSNFSDCGPTPHTAEIIKHNGSNALKLTSNDSDSSCADNVWVALFDTSKVGPLRYNLGFSVPLTSFTRISFSEEGAFFETPQASYGSKMHTAQSNFSGNAALIQPQGRGDKCITPPCFDNISLVLEDNHGNILVYVLQRPDNAEPNEVYAFYKEIFLDPAAGKYERNLFDDFSSIPAFNSSNANIVSIQFKIHDHGLAIIDDIAILSDDVGKTTTTTTALPPGGTCVNVAQGPWTFCLQNDDVFPGYCFLEFAGGKLIQQGCYLSYDYGVFSGTLNGQHWEGESVSGHFEFSGDFIGPSYTQFEGVFTLTDGSGISRRMTGQYGTVDEPETTTTTTVQETTTTTTTIGGSGPVDPNKVDLEILGTIFYMTADAPSDIHIGEQITVSISFNASTSDTKLDDPNRGLFIGGLYSLSLSIEDSGYRWVFGNGPDDQINTFNDTIFGSEARDDFNIMSWAPISTSTINSYEPLLMEVGFFSELTKLPLYPKMLTSDALHTGPVAYKDGYFYLGYYDNLNNRHDVQILFAPSIGSGS